MTFLKKYFLAVLIVAFALFVGFYVSYVQAEPEAGVRVLVEKIGPDEFSLGVKADTGILDWLIFPAQDYLNSKRGAFSGLPTGDGINCAKSFERKVSFSEKAFPLRITLQHCKEGSVGWGHQERTSAFTFKKSGEMSLLGRMGSLGFVTPLLSVRVPQAVRDCVLGAPDGPAMFSDWQAWGANPESRSRVGFTLETREIINMCVWRYAGIENPFFQSADGEPPLPKTEGVEITFPIPELGNCAGESTCRTYCETDDPGRIKTCLNFAKTHGLLNEEEAARGEKLADILEKGGPGGCKSKSECENYCNDVEHIDSCLDFAEANDFLPKDELAEARKVQSALKAGKNLPGGCKSKSECEAYCAEPARIRACLDFAKGAGLLSGQELAEAERVLPFIEKGETPGQCVSKNQCEAYCADDSHFNECIAFAERAGFVSSREAEAVRKSGGKTPGGCKSKEQCETYCGKPAHAEECIKFATETGLYTPEEAEKIKEEKGKEIIGAVEQKIDNCLARSCAEALGCFTGLEAEAKAQGLGGQEALPANLKSKIDAKINSCVAEFLPSGAAGGAFPQ